MAGFGQGDWRSPEGVATALDQKRKELDREIAEFKAQKEQEFRTFERRLSTTLAMPPERSLDDSEISPRPQTDTTAATPELQAAPPPPAAAAADPSPPTPPRARCSELQGLFLPHFIPLLDNPPYRRSSPPRSRSAELPPPSPAANFPATNHLSSADTPSLPLLGPPPANHPPRNHPEPQSPDYSPLTTPLAGVQPRSPSSPSAVPIRLRHSPVSFPRPASHSRSASSPNLHYPRPTRPSVTRTSSSQSDGSTTSLRSSMRKPSSSARDKKSVRISIDDVVMAPNESPVQTRSSSLMGAHRSRDDMDINNSSNVLERRGRRSSKDRREGKARIDDVGGAASRRRRSKHVGTSAAVHVDKRVKEPLLDYVPSQPVRGFALPTSSGRPFGQSMGHELIEPTIAPSQPDPREEFEDDPMFADPGGGGGANGQRPAFDEEDIFREDDDGRDEHDVVNGHDLQEAVDEDGLPTELPSPSPHAASLPIAIGSSRRSIGMA